ncbi:MAG: LysR family transcriptional regulator, partial [Myxococcales bacterium]|nr:LysR family transcriptional regulator [Myxococcales bacterium]
MNRPQPPLKGLDLNLLVTLRALLRVGSVTQAAEALGQTQPTVSRALATLRVAFDDPLLVRAGRGMARTPLAQAIWPRLEATLEVVDHLPEVGGFDPGSAVRTWRVVVPDMVAMPLQPVLLARMQVMAPRVALHFLAPGDAAGLLLAHQADLAVGPALDRPEIVTEA